MMSRSSLFDYERTNVGEGIVAFVSPEPRSGVVSGNSTVISGENYLLVVDAGHFPSVTKRIVSDIGQTFGKPVRFLVNTHWHNDHWRGNYLYRDQFPDITIISHTFTRRQIEEATDFHPQEILKRIPKAIQRRKEILRTGKREDGSLIENEEKRFLKEELEDVEAYVPSLPSMRVELPDLTFENEIVIDLGRRPVRISHLGRGNTAGDVVVLIPDSKVTSAGDLVVSPTPYAYGSYLKEWIETLKRLRATGSETIVPGHGPVQKDWRYVDSLIGLIQSVLDQVGDAVRQGLSLEDTRRKLNLSAYESLFAKDSQHRKHTFREYFAEPAIERAYLEMKFSIET
ncbi:MAG TPA: MBL fold metallo-hydrolase [Candidatus Bathyarchaeia archaeon]|nr:MBL fold metallo-hydrolase [Candidatus Bathyarchaeia archaeon]